ncbi:unnamed protein product [Caenorhabditis sp. 36 PRJEB53466]|nr:unnamed protein product [Caenorhabditis sp. 36 PRJEB53466]
MENLLREEENDDDSRSELSELELEELVTTKFVAEYEELKKEVSEVEDVELVRAVASPILLRISPIEHSRRSDGVILEEYDCLRRPIEEKTNLDGATDLMDRIRKASDQELATFFMWNIFEKSKKWKQTSRDTELSLINSSVSMVDARPHHLHFFCRRLTESDIVDVIHKCLSMPDPPIKYRSLLRMTIKTEMPLKQFLNKLQQMTNENLEMERTNEMVTASQKQSDGSNRKFRTLKIDQFSQLEHFLCNGSLLTMGATTRFEFGMRSRHHVSVNVEYNNEVDVNGRRAKSIVVEQMVTPLPGILPTKRVTFGLPLVEDVVFFEIPVNAPFNPLGVSSRITDLIEHLESMNPAVKSVNFKNVTFR